VSLCVGVISQIGYVNIPILPLKNGSNIVHGAEQLKITRFCGCYFYTPTWTPEPY